MMNLKNMCSTPTKMHGLALVEITIVLPFLLLLMVASIEGGRLLYSYNTLTKVTRDGARYFSNDAFLGTTSSIDVIGKSAAVKNYVVYGDPNGGATPRLDGLTTGHITVSSSGNYLTVEADYPFTSIFGTTLTNLSFGSSPVIPSTLHTEVVMRAVN